MKIQFFLKFALIMVSINVHMKLQTAKKCLTKGGLYIVFGLFLSKSNVFKLHNFIASYDIKE